jgi:hypothetical protein
MGIERSAVLFAALCVCLVGCASADGGGEGAVDAATAGSDVTQRSSWDTSGAQEPDASPSPADDAAGTSDGMGNTSDTGGAATTCDGATAGVACDDGDCCTLDDQCQACDPSTDPECSGEGLTCQGTTACVDDDANDCALSACNCSEEGAPLCVQEDAPNGAACDFDTNDCTLGDTCLGGECIKSQPLPLDDGNPCTEDSCVKGELIHTALLEGQCDDGNECTTGDVCVTGTCTGGDQVACVVGPCMADATCVAGEGCVESPLPVGAFCGMDNACVVSAACNEDYECEVVENVNCDDGNACTADSCDPVSGCAHDEAASDGSVCELDSEAGCVAGGLCTAGMCVAESVTDCADDDGCCADGCDANTDSDCSASCGNGVTEGSEQCDGDCPTECVSADACQNGVLVGSADACSAQCSYNTVTQCVPGDGCCPPGCVNAIDHDCEALCGNGVIDAGELCDGLCPTDCQGQSTCGASMLVGSAADCDAECIPTAVTGCIDGDGCCPSGCAGADDDCVVDQPCEIDIDVQCVAHPTWAAIYKISVAASPGIMNVYLNTTAVDEPPLTSLLEGGWCWNTTGDSWRTLQQPKGCLDVIYDTITEESDCSNNGPVSSCVAQVCYECP